MKIYCHNVWNFNPHGFGYEPLRQRMKLVSELTDETGADVTADCLTHRDYPFLNDEGVFSEGPKALTSSDHCPLIAEFDF